MGLPLSREDGWLPSGHYSATWAEVIEYFGGENNSLGSHRAMVMNSLLTWRDMARAKGMSGLVILDGSFISKKRLPGDFDLVFLYDEASEAIAVTDPDARALIDFQACKTLGFMGDVFALPSSLQKMSPALSGLDMFDYDRTGVGKGVIEVAL